LNIVRLEDASLFNLLSLSKEMFDRMTLPDGSVFLFGSASYLSRVGSDTYAKDWVTVVSQANSIWRGIKICPLIPLITTSCPGTLAREILELATWFDSVYENNPAGLLATWTAVVAATEKCSEGATTLSAMDAYKISLPVSLNISAPVQSTTFCASSSRPVTLQGLPKDTLCELLSTLIKTIHGNFQTCASPESFLARATSMVGAEQYVQKVVLVGASNLRSSACHFSSAGYDVQDLTVPGWVASPENIEKMKAKVEETNSDSNTVFVFDLFGNSA
jgi:hypothetical protein